MRLCFRAGGRGSGRTPVRCRQSIDDAGGEDAYLNQIAQSGFDDRTYCNLLYINQCYQVLKKFRDAQNSTLGLESTMDNRVQEWTENTEVLTSELFELLAHGAALVSVCAATRDLIPPAK